MLQGYTDNSWNKDMNTRLGVKARIELRKEFKIESQFVLGCVYTWCPSTILAGFFPSTNARIQAHVQVLGY